LKFGTLATLDRFKLKEGSRRKYCSSISSGLSTGLDYNGIIVRVNLSKPSEVKKGKNFPYTLYDLFKYPLNLVANCTEEPSYLAPVSLCVKIYTPATALPYASPNLSLNTESLFRSLCRSLNIITGVFIKSFSDSSVTCKL